MPISPDSVKVGHTYAGHRWLGDRRVTAVRPSLLGRDGHKERVVEFVDCRTGRTGSSPMSTFCQSASGPSRGPLLGQILGQVALPVDLASYAQTEGDAFWDQQVAADFSDQVYVTNPPSAGKSLASVATDWLPVEDLAKMGLQPALHDDEPRVEVVMTTGVDYHTDDAHEKLYLLWVLRNDRMWFSQRGAGAAIQPAPGDWFLFDSSKPHKMDLRKPNIDTPRLVFVCFSVELARIGQ